MIEMLAASTVILIVAADELRWRLKTSVVLIDARSGELIDARHDTPVDPRGGAGGKGFSSNVL